MLAESHFILSFNYSMISDGKEFHLHLIREGHYLLTEDRSMCTYFLFIL